jgi:ATP-dependent helicase Lhr and Lhr-like helicase
MRPDSLPGEILTISAADPLNLTGILLPGDRISSVSGKTISLQDGIHSAADESVSTFPGYMAV